MTWKFKYFEDENFVRVTEEGVFTAEGHNRMTTELVSQDFWEPGMSILFDSTNLDLSDTEYEDVRNAAKRFISHDKQLGCGKIALYMKSVSDFGRGRQFEMLIDEKICATIGVFLNENQALRWLDVKISEAA